MLQHRISVCVCTYKRPKLLAKALHKIQTQKTQDLFTYSIVVVDNDKEQSAKETVKSIQKETGVELFYYVETRQGISHARNMAVEKAKGDFIAFIDDDEFPEEDWLLSLFNTCMEYDADGVIGVVLPYFEKPPPAWLEKEKLLFWRNRTTGTILNTGTTGNSFFKKSVAESEKPPFNPEFNLSGGEDSLFFQKRIKNGNVFVGCGEAVVHEFVPSWRMGIVYLLKRFFWDGVNTIRVFRLTEGFACRLKWFLKSVIAMAGFSILLPVLLLVARHLFFKYLLKISYFFGVFLEFLHKLPVSDRNKF